MDPVIRYLGNLVRVTPDTAREFVDRGEAELIEGELGSPAIIEDVPEVVEDVPQIVTADLPAAPKVRKQRTKKTKRG